MREIRLTISKLGWRGEGIAEGPVYVAGALPGETVKASVEGDRGTVLSIDQPSPARIQPFCPHFGSCGGCQLQHWHADAYRAWKADLVVEAFNRNGIAIDRPDLIDAHGAGRRRVSLHVRKTASGVSAGFMVARSHVLHDLESCPILVPELQSSPILARRVGAILGDCDVALTACDTGIDCAVKAERKVVQSQLPRLARLAQELGLVRFAVNGDIIATPAPPLVTMGSTRVNLPPGAFLQATAAGEQALATLVLKGLGKAKVVADLFCGLGPFALRIAERARVEAYDSDRQAIAALQAAHRHASGLKPVVAQARDLMREPLVASELSGFDAAVFDPPRAGAEAQARQLARARIKTVVAVSCDPATLARDAAILLGGGYRIATITTVDQFKWSSHVETVAVFQSLARST